jgi:hypothetical protein
VTPHPSTPEAVAPVAEAIARALIGAKRPTHPASLRRRRAPAVAPVVELPTPLTQARRRAGREPVRRQTAAGLGRACTVCGAALTGEQTRYCAACLPVHAPEALSKAHTVLERRRDAGDDPAHGGDATRRRRERTSATWHAAAAWAREHPERPSAEAFTRDILPRLRSVPIEALMQATGLSRPYCALVRRELRVPHPRHWDALAALPSTERGRDWDP